MALAEIGDKIVFLYPENGYELDKLQVKELLVEAETYTVKQVDKSEMHTRFELEEIPGRWFNSAHFETRENLMAGAGYPTIDLNGSFCALVQIAKIVMLAETHGGLLIRNCGAPASGPGTYLIGLGRDVADIPAAFAALDRERRNTQPSTQTKGAINA